MDMSFIDFVRDENESRHVVVVTDDDGQRYYRINYGKKHFDDPHMYINGIIGKGWKKVSHREYHR